MLQISLLMRSDADVVKNSILLLYYLGFLPRWSGADLLTTP